MPTPAKTYYRVSEVASMLNIPVSTVNYWVMTFDELSPPTTRGGHRRYRPEDIELIKRIKVMMHDRAMSIEGAKRQLKESRVPWRGFKCDGRDRALLYLGDVSEIVRDNPKAVAMLGAVMKWIENNN